MKRNIEELYKQLASAYVEREGEELHREDAALRAQAEGRATPALDAKLKWKLRGIKRRRYMRIASMAAAACLVLALFLPLALRSFNMAGESRPDETGQTVDAAEPTSPAVSEEQEAGLPPATSYPSAAEDTAPGEYERLALRLTAASGFSINRSEQDRGETIYYIDDELRDDVVVTLKRAGEQPDYSGLTPMELNGREAYGTYRADYSVLVFLEDGILYTMTCRYDFNTLVRLEEVILI